MLKRFFAQFTDVPTVGLHAAMSALLALVFTLVLLIGLVIGRPIDNTVTITVGTFILGYLTKTSYDFQTKRKTEVVTPPDVMAQDAAAPSVASTLPPDLTRALDTSLQPTQPTQPTRALTPPASMPQAALTADG